MVLYVTKAAVCVVVVVVVAALATVEAAAVVVVVIVVVAAVVAVIYLFSSLEGTSSYLTSKTRIVAMFSVHLETIVKKMCNKAVCMIDLLLPHLTSLTKWFISHSHQTES